MSDAADKDISQRVYRIDKFVVPEHGREEFLDRVAATHAVLHEQEGFVQDFILEQESGPGEFNFVTFAEWTNAGAIEKAADAVKKLHAETGFDRQEFMSRLGIEADIANYRKIDI